MSTLIIGCGYLGQHVAAQLQRRDERVHGTVRSPGRAAAIAALGIEPIIADVLAPESLIGLPRVERIVYCVGFDRAAGSSIQAVYVDGLKNVLESLGATPTRLVYASSTGVYGQTEGEWVDETAETIPRNPSGQACLEAEAQISAWQRARGQSATAVILRFSGLYGPGRAVRRSVLERGDPIPGDSLKFLNLIHIEDAAQAVVAALFVDQPEPLYLVSDDRPVTRQEYYSRMAALLHAPAPRFVPPHPGSPEAARDASNKRVANNLAKKSLGVVLSYPDITTGLTTCAEP